MTHKPVVAIVGRPNVGKSTLFNRLIGRNRSIVADQPGVTRDRIYADAALSTEHGDRPIVLVDTGGFDPGTDDPIMQRVLEQTQLAIDEADVVVLLTDGRAGLLPEDTHIATVLRKSGKRVLVAVNKVDGALNDLLVGEFYSLGLPYTIPVSAAHGRNIRALEELIGEQLPILEGDTEAIEEPPTTGEDPSESVPPIRVAVIGRPNVGKSSLVNRLLGEDRHLVSEVAGTTIDSVDSKIERDGQAYVFVDTAGIRRKRSIAMRVEKFSVVAALKGLERSDVALLLLDASQEVAEQDAKVSAFAYEKGKAVILVVSKWDVKRGEGGKEQYKEKVRQELAHLSYAPIVFTSARTGYGMDRLLPEVRRVHEEYGRRISTGELNRFVEVLTEHTPPPGKKGKKGKIYYVTQIGVRPPRFLISVNDPELIHFSYRRFLVNELRTRYGFGGVPLYVGYRAHGSEAKARATASVKRKAKKRRAPR